MWNAKVPSLSRREVVLDAPTPPHELEPACFPSRCERWVHPIHLHTRSYSCGIRGGRISRQRIRQIVAAAAKLASKRLLDKGVPALPNTTPHTLRRTYISIALLANEFDVNWVMVQVGHADSTMTMDVYAQLQQRNDRKHGANFDRLVRTATRHLAGVSVLG